MPKSSMAMRTPRPCNSSSCGRAATMSAMTMSSVISTVSADAPMPARVIALATFSTRLPSLSSADDRLIDMLRFGERSRSSDAARAASLSTNSPNCVENPPVSMIGMNLPGRINPRVGCCHRTSASNPSTSRLPVLTIGW